MTPPTDPDLLTIRRGLRLVQEADPAHLALVARNLAVALRCPAEDGTPPSAEALRLSTLIERLYSREAA